VAIGSELLPGPILEVLRVERIQEDGWPPGEDFDALFLASPDSIQLVLAETLGDREQPQFAWLRTPAGEQAFGRAQIRWLEMETYEDARRDIPRKWSFRIPDSEVRGEIEAIGYNARLGPERGGRRAVEIRYSVAGWIEIEGERHEVSGSIRHTQR
jgi:hypothetical protein